MAVSEQSRYSLRSVVSDLTDMLTIELVNIMQNAHDNISHFERNNFDKIEFFIQLFVILFCLFVMERS